MQHLKIFTCFSIVLFTTFNANSQGFLKKIKQKAQEAADKVIDKKVDDAVGVDNSNTNSNNTDMSSVGRNGRPSNKTGEGLISTPPNVNENLTSAETSFKAAKYSDARYAVHQAMVGVEMEIGKKILDGLPETISGLKKDASSDKVTSAGWGMG